MQYAAIVNGEAREVDVVESSPDLFRVEMNGQTFEVDLRAVNDSTLSVVIDGQAYDIQLESHPEGGQAMLVRGEIVNVEVLDLRRMRLREAQAASAGPDGPATIICPMPGKIVAVLVEEGQEVAEGDGLVIVEAMKMENELKSPKSGVVRDISAEIGTAVEGGVTLCVVE